MTVLYLESESPTFDTVSRDNIALSALRQLEVTRPSASGFTWS